MKPILIPFPIARYLPADYQFQPNRGPAGYPAGLLVTFLGFPSDELRFDVGYFGGKPAADAELPNRNGVIVIDAGARLIKARSLHPIGDGAYEWIRDVFAIYRAYIDAVLGRRACSENARFCAVTLEDFWTQDGAYFRDLLRNAPAL